MKILFAVEKDNGWESVISERFGRSEGFMLYNDDNNSLTFHSNTENVNAGHGAGIQASQKVIDLGATKVLTGGAIGPKAFEVLNNSKIGVFTDIGEIVVKKAYEGFKSGNYLEYLGK